MIPRREFGRTGHQSSRVIFGGWALNKATQRDANRAFVLLQDYGVNHIDVAPMYGNAEKVLGPLLAENRDDFFVATKTRQRSLRGARDDLERSLERLCVDRIDLWQMHGLTNAAGWERAFGADGTIGAFVEAREEGLVRYLGVTGHGSKAAEMHLKSLARFDFDAVMLPYNHAMMQNPAYAARFEELEKVCSERQVALQAIKTVAKRPWSDRPKTFNTYFYEPLATQEAIDTAVHWVLGHPTAFLVAAGDLRLLPRILDAADRFEARPSEAEMLALAEEYSIQRVFK